MSRLYASGCAGLLALMAALNSGLPFWRDFPIGDAFDFGVTTAIGVYAFIGAFSIKLTINNIPLPSPDRSGEAIETPKSGSTGGESRISSKLSREGRHDQG